MTSATMTTLFWILPDTGQWIITILAGTLTVITGIEGYFKFNQRVVQHKKQRMVWLFGNSLADIEILDSYNIRINVTQN